MASTAEEFDLILDRTVSALQAGGCTPEDCLASYPAERAGLEPLLRLSARLQGAGSLVQPSPRFQDAAPARLRSLVTAQASTQPRAYPVSTYLKSNAPRRAAVIPRPARPRFMPALVALLVLALILSGIGTIAVSAQALPGDFLYPVKRAQESVQLTFSVNAAVQAGLYVEFANRRMGEALALLQQDRTDPLGQALADYDDQILSGLAFLGQDSHLSPAEQSALAGKLLNAVTSHEARLSSVMDTAPQSVRVNLAAALTTSKQAHTQAAIIMRSLQSAPGGSGQASPPALNLKPTLTLPAVTPIPATPVPPTAPAPSPLPASPTHLPLPGVLPGRSSTQKPTLPPAIRPSATRPSFNAIITRTPFPWPTKWITPTKIPTKPSILPFFNFKPSPTPRPTPRPWTRP